MDSSTNIGMGTARGSEVESRASSPDHVVEPLVSEDVATRPMPSVTHRLYVSHFLSTWNTRGFEFGAVLFLATAYPGTLMPMSIYALIRSLSAIVFSPVVGKYIDTRNRLEVVRLSIVAQRTAVVLSCVAFWFLLHYRRVMPPFLSTVLLVILVFFACVEKLCAIMNMISVERDWVVVIGQGDEATLRTMNAQMRRIDLFCKIVSPLAIALIDGWSSQIAIIATLVINGVSVCIEYSLIATVYRRVRALSQKEISSKQVESSTTKSSLSGHLSTIRASLSTYITHPTFLPSFSLSLLYFTVVSFAGQMTTYLLAIGLSSTTVGLLRTVSTAFELSATYIAPYLMSRIGAVRAGIWSMSWLTVCVTCVVASLWATPTSHSSSDNQQAPASPPILFTTIFLTFTILSRIGTWSFDLCAQLIIQDEISAHERGAFSSTEASVRNLFELCRFAATIVFSRPDQFRYPALMTLIAIYVSGSFYAKFVRDRRGHLLHIPFCLSAHSKGHTRNNQDRGRYEILDLNASHPHTQDRPAEGADSDEN